MASRTDRRGRPIDLGAMIDRRDLRRRALGNPPPISPATKLLYTAIFTAFRDWRAALRQSGTFALGGRLSPTLEPAPDFFDLAREYVQIMVDVCGDGIGSPFITVQGFWRFRLTVRRVRRNKKLGEAITELDDLLETFP